MANPLDQLKIVASNIGQIASNIAALRAIDTENRQKLASEQGRTVAWMTEKAAIMDAAWECAYRGPKAQILQEAERAERIANWARNPAMALSSYKVLGAGNAVDDCALKGEFRNLMQTLTPTARADWFEKLSVENDFGRLGILVSVDPQLEERALGLDIPGRDEVLKLTADINREVKNLRHQEILQRQMVLTHLTRPLTQAEELELVRMGGELHANQNAAKPELIVTSEEDQNRFDTLMAKSELLGQLSKAEGLEVVKLGAKLKAASDSALAKSKGK